MWQSSPGPDRLTDPCTPHPGFIQSTSITLKVIFSVPLRPIHPKPLTGFLSLEFCLFQNAYKWDHTIWGLVGLALSLRKMYLRCTLLPCGRGSSLYRAGVSAAWMGRGSDVHPPAEGHPGACRPGPEATAAVSICLQVLCGSVFRSLEQTCGERFLG